MKPQQLISARRSPYGHENAILDENGASSNLSLPSGLELAPDLRLCGQEALDRARFPDPAAAGPLNAKQVFDFPTPSEAQLRGLLDLTIAEARLARLLASGDSLEDVAEKLSIKLTTARSQLAAIFAKTGIRRQAKLVAILSRIAHLE
jgi:DNA-binding CsgD family transcriptional regulator